MNLCLLVIGADLSLRAPGAGLRKLATDKVEAAEGEEDTHNSPTMVPRLGSTVLIVAANARGQIFVIEEELLELLLVSKCHVLGKVVHKLQHPQELACLRAESVAIVFGWREKGGRDGISSLVDCQSAHISEKEGY